MVRRAKTTVTSSTVVTLCRLARIAEREAKEERKHISAAEANAFGTLKRKAPIPATTPPTKRQNSTAANLITPVFNYSTDSSDSIELSEVSGDLLDDENGMLLPSPPLTGVSKNLEFSDSSSKLSDVPKGLPDDERGILLSTPTGSPHPTSDDKSDPSDSSESSDSSGPSQFSGEEWSDDSSELSDVPNELVSPPSYSPNPDDDEGYISGDEDGNPSVGSKKTLRAIYQQYRSPRTEEESRGLVLYRRISESEYNPGGDRTQVVVYFRGHQFEDIGSDDLPMRITLEEGVVAADNEIVFSWAGIFGPVRSE
ncbi:hypothetical protein RUND412_011482 [Rhizina undulata]